MDRYDPERWYMVKHSDGEWVEFAEVKRIEAELERLRAIVRDGLSEDTKRELLEGMANAVVASAFGPPLESEAVKRLTAEVERLHGVIERVHELIDQEFRETDTSYEYGTQGVNQAHRHLAAALKTGA